MLGKRGIHQKLNNQGMTLVEVLVAMIIISIAGVAFLQSFANAAKYNTRAREKQYALYLAQSVMEDFKAVSLEKMDKKFTDGTSSFPQYTMDSLSGSSSSGYSFSGIEFNKLKYDVSVEVSAGSGPQSEEEYEGQIMEAFNPQPKDDSGSQDGFFREPLEAIESALKYDAYLQIYQYTNAVDGSGDPLYPGLKEYMDTIDYNFIPDSCIKIVDRQITASFSGNAIGVTEQIAYTICGFEYIIYNEESGDEVEEVLPDILVKYGLTDTPAVSLPSCLNDTTDPTGEFRDAYTCYSSGEAIGSGTYRLIFYYYPCYAIFGKENLTGTEFTSDVIFLNNAYSSNPFEVFVVKQNVLNGLSSKFSNLTTCETQYSAFLRKTGTGTVNLHTNLRDIFTETPNADTGYAKRPHFSGFNESLGYDHYKAEPGNVFCFGFGGGYDAADDTSGLWYNDSSEKQVLLYSVKVTVSLNGEDIYVLNGSVNRK